MSIEATAQHTHDSGAPVPDVSVIAPSSTFLSLLQEQIRNEFNASHQYVATAVWFDNEDLPQLAKFFYKQAVEERNHAMMIVQYFLDRGIAVDLGGVDPAVSGFEVPREAISLALEQEKAVTEQMIRLARTARDEGDYIGEQFMQWFLKEQVEEVSSMTTLLTIADRAGRDLFHIEDFVAREMKAADGTPGAPETAGGSL
ncbi:ferritin [Rhodococcus triatomae]|uniref:Ferritin n=1 Tax=Rhodococcus triatomae TaxID=300028 RepID=A0A1G8HV89_9NOCA|nr:ferritin [Rhodococcus triatomae]QNG20886.1 ferritin [Rhodococcus triatomae]QNG23199.1 ferritin [Rhodococcus triatomae]SDI10462.1 Ferritin [Rhodococcus triatomae]